MDQFIKVVYINVPSIRNIADVFYILYSIVTHMCLKGLPMFRCNLDNETRGRFTEQPYDIADVLSAGKGRRMLEVLWRDFKSITRRLVYASLVANARREVTKVNPCS